MSYCRDPSGSEKYIHVTKKYFSNASGIMFVYDVTYYKSFHNIFKWIEIVNQQIGEHMSNPCAYACICDSITVAEIQYRDTSMQLLTNAIFQPILTFLRYWWETNVILKEDQSLLRKERS